MRSILFVCVFSVFFTTIWINATAAQAPAAKTPVGEYTISGPYTHGNLSVFLIHGKDRLTGKQFLTLQEAFDQKKVIVYETGDVNKLAIENTGEIDVYIQSGDIVKGGRQDRTISMDFIAPARSGKMPIDAFCVEHGRWQQRGNEGSANFASADYSVASKDLKMAAKYDADQSKVWAEVSEAQKKLSANLGGSVASPQSASSMQLSLENAKVQQSTDEYAKELSPLLDGKPDVIGYAFAINGKMNSADVYANSNLFKKLWPKLLRASSVEAIGEIDKDAKFAPATIDAVKASVDDAASGKASEKPVTDRVKMITTEGKDNVLFETRDQKEQGEWVHRNYIAK